ncbi:hypothetical protein [Streptomyces sp. NPDC006267]|uniref:hypothetical protein n=1 Tax=Streptomyces sp. NPDC006267 TaxID=3157173 RepID=UPI0033A212DC
MAQKARRRAHPGFGRVGQERLAQVSFRQAALQPFHRFHRQRTGLPDTQQEVTARVAPDAAQCGPT